MLLDTVTYPFTAADTAGYVEDATNVLAGKGLRRTPGCSAPSDADLVYSPAFPPGFSLAVAGLGKLGVPPVLGVLWVPWTAWALLPIAILFALGAFLSPWIAMAIAALVTTSPGVIEAGYHALSDIPFFLAAVCSVGLLIRHGPTPRTTLPLAVLWLA